MGTVRSGCFILRGLSLRSHVDNAQQLARIQEFNAGEASPGTLLRMSPLLVEEERQLRELGLHLAREAKNAGNPNRTFEDLSRGTSP